MVHFAEDDECLAIPVTTPHPPAPGPRTVYGTTMRQPCLNRKDRVSTQNT